MQFSLSPTVKNSLLTALFSSLLTLMVLTLANFFLNHTWNMFAPSSSSQPFTVQGTGTVTQKPNSVQITFDVVKTAPMLQDAQNIANTSSNTIVADIEKLGTAKKDIQTGSYSSNPNYDNANSGGVGIAMPIRQNGTTIVSYTVRETVTVTLSDVAKANKVIDVATKDGAENIFGPNLTFSQSDQEALKQKALLLAIADAKKKAGALADAAGIRLGRVLNVTENTGGPFPIQPLRMGVVEGNVGTGSVPTQINPGESSVTVTVTLSYETW